MRCTATLAATAAFPLLLAVDPPGRDGRALADDRSPIVLNCDGAGTTIAKPVGDTLFQVQQLWSTNASNGIQSFPGGNFAFVNCTPTLRTPTENTLSCSVFDPVLQSWGEPPIVTTVSSDFLDGPFVNPFNSIGELNGEYLTIFEVGGEGYSFRLRFLDATLAEPGGFPVLIGTTSPTAGAFLVRDVDRPGGASGRTNFTVGMQYDDLCFDFAVTPTQPGGVLVGELRARTLEDGGLCGAVVAENLSVALTPTGPSGRAGGVCSYVVVDPGRCFPPGIPFSAGSTLCLPCAGDCREFPGGVDFVYRNPNPLQSSYIDCLDVKVELAGSECSYGGCTDELPAITILRSPTPSASLAAALSAHPSGTASGPKP